MAKTKHQYNSYTDKGDKYMICMNSIETSPFFKGQLCGRYSKVSDDAVAKLCFQCTSKLVAFNEPIRTNTKSDKPRGWAFMAEYVHKDGTVYHKGVEQPELKGTLDPTPVKPKKTKKLSKSEKVEKRTELLTEYNNLKKQHQKESRKTYKSKIKSQMNKIQRELKKI